MGSSLCSDAKTFNQTLLGGCGHELEMRNPNPWLEGGIKNQTKQKKNPSQEIPWPVRTLRGFVGDEV